MKKGVLFDMDGVLVKSFTTEVLPGVAELLLKLKEAGTKVGVATNQAGSLWRLATGNTKYPTPEQLASNLTTIACSLGMENDLWLVSLSDLRVLDTGNEERVNEMLYHIQKKLIAEFAGHSSIKLSNIKLFQDAVFRKPNAGMLRQAYTEWSIKPSEMFYVGDMESDQIAAERANVPFLHVSRIQEVLC